MLLSRKHCSRCSKTRKSHFLPIIGSFSSLSLSNEKRTLHSSFILTDSLAERLQTTQKNFSLIFVSCERPSWKFALAPGSCSGTSLCHATLTIVFDGRGRWVGEGVSSKQAYYWWLRFTRLNPWLRICCLSLSTALQVKGQPGKDGGIKHLLSRVLLPPCAIPTQRMPLAKEANLIVIIRSETSFHASKLSAAIFVMKKPSSLTWRSSSSGFPEFRKISGDACSSQRPKGMPPHLADSKNTTVVSPSSKLVRTTKCTKSQTVDPTPRRAILRIFPGLQFPSSLNPIRGY